LPYYLASQQNGNRPNATPRHLFDHQAGLCSDWPLVIGICARQCKCRSVMKALFSMKQIFELKNSRIYGKN
jgi:hypothetical protein